AGRFDAEESADAFCAQHRLCICGRQRYMALGRSGAQPAQDARLDSAHLFRGSGAAQSPAQPWQAVRKFCSQRHPLQVLAPSTGRTRRASLSGIMVPHRRRRTVLTVLALYTFAALFIGYFAANAFTGNHGLRAQQDLEQQLIAMKGELSQLKAERALWE